MSERPEKGPGALCHFHGCKEGPRGSRGVIAQGKRPDAIYCRKECGQAAWQEKHPDRVPRRGGTPKRSYKRSRERGRDAGKRPDTLYRVGIEIDGSTLWLGRTRANKPAVAKAKVLKRKRATLVELAGGFCQTVEQLLEEFDVQAVPDRSLAPR